MSGDMAGLAEASYDSRPDLRWAMSGAELGEHTDNVVGPVRAGRRSAAPRLQLLSEQPTRAHPDVQMEVTTVNADIPSREPS